MRSWRISSVLLVVVLAVVMTGCPKKKPAPAPAAIDTETVTVAPPPTEVTQPTPSTAADETEPLLSADLEEVNRHVASQGLLGDIYYDFDQYELRTESRDRLAKNADFLKSRPEFQVTIEGHCDERGTNDYNLALGERRAAAARDYLVSLGVAADRLRTISYGEERPACNSSDEACWSQNRRAHFVITGRSNVG